MDATRTAELPVTAADGHRFELQARLPERACARLLWLPALGVSARHYLPFADALAARGVAVFVHEWRGHGSSNARASRGCDWGYRELLDDIHASEAAADALASTSRRILGGHSLGGQLACCRIGLDPHAAAALWVVASGTPYWRCFPQGKRWWLPLAYRFLPWLARLVGHLPGRRIGFGGNEAARVMADWARSGLSGHYRPSGFDADLEAGMARYAGHMRGIAFADDWLGPMAALRHLADKLPQARIDLKTLNARQLNVRADHYGWMQQPDAVVAALVDLEW